MTIRRGRPRKTPQPVSATPKVEANTFEPKISEPIETTATEITENQEEIMTQGNGNSNNNKAADTEAAKRLKMKEKQRQFDEKVTTILDRITFWSTMVVSVPFRLFGGLMEMFVESGMPGAKIMGSLLFFGGVAYTADSYWIASGNNAIFPWFNESFTGWSFAFILSPFFWFIFVLCLCFQYLQSETLRGMSPNQAKKRMEEANAYTAVEAPQGKIKVASIYHKAYINSGVRHNKIKAFASLSTLVVDTIVIFASRNPFDWADRIFLGFWVIVFVNILQAWFLAEAGYLVWKAEK